MTRTDDDNATPGSSVTTETYEDKFKFSLEFAKRWGDPRAPPGIDRVHGRHRRRLLCCSTTGSKFSVDAWNFNSKEPHNEQCACEGDGELYARASTLFVNGGYDNFLNSRPVCAASSASACGSMTTT